MEATTKIPILLIKLEPGETKEAFKQRASEKLGDKEKIKSLLYSKLYRIYL